MENKHLRRLITTAVFLAISLVLRTTFIAYIPLFGANGMRVGIHGVFTIMPAILFGPWYGAVASGLGDVLGFMMANRGEAWLWQMTIIVTVGGFVRGWAWRLLRGRSPVGTRSVVVAATLLFLCFGSFSMVQLRQEGITRHFYDNVEDPRAVDASQMNYISRLIISRTQNTMYPYRTLPARIAETAYAPMLAGAFGIALLGVDFYLTKKLAKDESGKLRVVRSGDSKPIIAGNDPPMEIHSSRDCGSPSAPLPLNNETASVPRSSWHKGLASRLQAPWNGSIMPLALTIIIVSLLINTANSMLLWAINMFGWRSFPFMFIWLPRIVAAFLISIVNVFIAVFLMKVCERLPHLKALTK